MGGGGAARLISRRATLRLGAMTALALAASPLVAACGRANDQRLRILNWQDYIDPNLVADFEAQAGVAVTYSTYDSNDALADQMALAGVSRRRGRDATTVDLIVPSDNLFRRLRDQERLRPLDTTVVTEELLGNLDPAMRQLDADPGNRFGVPWATGATGIGYDTTVFPEPPDWEVFLSGEHAGRMTLLNERREAFAAALYAGGGDPNTTDTGELARAEETLTSMLANAQLDAATYLDRLAAGELVAAQAFSTDLLQARRANLNLAFVIPPQGGTRWVDLLCVPDGAPNPDLANRFVAYYLDPKVSAANATAIQADTGNAAAREFVPPDLLAEPAAFPPEADAGRLTALRDLGDDEQLYLDAWDRVTSAAKG
jgi:spermidine/putrescine transport system substrate-binding protein